MTNIYLQMHILIDIIRLKMLTKDDFLFLYARNEQEICDILTQAILSLIFKQIMNKVFNVYESPNYIYYYLLNV